MGLFRLKLCTSALNNESPGRERTARRARAQKSKASRLNSKEALLFYTEFRNQIYGLPGFRRLSLPGQLTSKSLESEEIKVEGGNEVFESEWIRFGRITYLDAGNRAQLVCGAVYMDCMINTPPLVFDVIFLGSTCDVDSGSSWMMSLDFIPLIESKEYQDMYIQPLKDLRRKFNRITTNFPKEFYESKRWTSKGILFSSGRTDNALGQDQTIMNLLQAFSEAINLSIKISQKSWESRDNGIPASTLKLQLEFLDWLNEHPQPSSLLIDELMGSGWMEYTLKSVWRDTQGLSRWGGPECSRSVYHEVYEDVLQEYKGDINEANMRLMAAGLQPLEYVYFDPHVDGVDWDS